MSRAKINAVVVAQLAKRSLPISKDPGSNPVIGNFYWTFFYCLLFVEKMKIKKKRPGNAPFKKKKSNDYKNLRINMVIHIHKSEVPYLQGRW